MGHIRRLLVWLAAITAILAFVTGKTNAAAESAGLRDEISYLVRWQPTADALPGPDGIGMSLAFTAEATRTAIHFPHRWAFGLHDLHRRITDISVDGSPYAASLLEPRIELATRPGRRVTVEFRLRTRPSGTARSFPEALLPAATRESLVLLGQVGLAVPDFFRCTRQSCREYPVTLRWDVPRSWRVAHDHGGGARNFTVPAIDWRTWRDALFIAGSTFHARPLPAGGELVIMSPARLSDAARAVIDDAAHVAAVVEAHWPAIRSGRAVWLDRLAAKGTGTDRGGIQATSNFALFDSNPERNRASVLRTFVHEYLHGWIGLQLFAVDGRKSPPAHFRWFAEGFVDYFTEVFLFRAGRRSLHEMVEAYNEAQRVFLRQPDPTISLHAMATRQARRHRRLPYVRGFVLAYELAARLREGARATLEQRVLRVVGEAGTVALSLPDLLALLADGDADTAQWLRAVLLERKPLLVRPAALGPCVRPVRVPASVAGLGFDPVWSAKLGRVVDLHAGSAAAGAGLQEGDELVGFSLDDDVFRTRAQRRLHIRRSGEARSIVFRPDSGIERRTTRRFEVDVDDPTDSLCGSPWS